MLNAVAKYCGTLAYKAIYLLTYIQANETFIFVCGSIRFLRYFPNSAPTDSRNLTISKYSPHINAFEPDF